MIQAASTWQRMGWLASCFLVGTLCWCLYSGSLWRSASDASDAMEDVQSVDRSIPSRDYAPAEVVTLQVESMRDSLKDSSKLKVCYSLASPENRRFTGPFARFAQMLMTPPYDSIATSQVWQLGTTAIESDYAAVLVSTISTDGKLSAFRFMLHRHTDAPYEGCWLTEAVQVLEKVQVPGVRQPATVEELPVD